MEGVHKLAGSNKGHAGPCPARLGGLSSAQEIIGKLLRAGKKGRERRKKGIFKKRGGREFRATPGRQERERKHVRFALRDQGNNAEPKKEGMGREMWG